ncbi:MAG TPA: SdrD B-like domain-containing protein [Longilinea sp.]|nr:SdrD B-like domain-containing protein [Longilinea sp.]
MKKIFHTIFFLALLLGLSIIAVACSPILPTCEAGSLQAPTLVSPNHYEVVGSLLPTLTWTYPDNSCEPEGYAISLSPGPYFNDYSLNGGTGNPSTSWSPGEELQPGMEYKWNVQAGVGTTFGPYSPQMTSFFTGPLCSLDSLIAPTLLEPQNYATVTESNINLTLDYLDDCLPPGYVVYFSTDQTFSDSTPWVRSPNMTHYFINLTDCTRYYWKVVASDGNVYGPESEVFTFRTDFTGSCPAEGATGSISGYVWNDICDVPYGTVPDPLPSNCVYNTMHDGVWADAYRDTENEQGIAGAVVGIGPGECPSYQQQTAVTDANGYYIFTGLEQGQYCLSINAEVIPVELPGLWTWPMSGHEGWTYHFVTLQLGQNAVLWDFGWYHYPDAAVVPNVTVDVGSPQIQVTIDPGIIPLVTCSLYTNSTDCNAHEACQWHQPLTGALGHCESK